MAQCRRHVCGGGYPKIRQILLEGPYPPHFFHHPAIWEELYHTADDAERHIRAHLTTILGSLRCRSDVQLADGKALLLKYVSSYVTKLHESATSEGLYCNGVTGYQAANSFFRTVTPLEPEMIFKLASTKVRWTDKMTLLFRPPFPGQTDSNKAYQFYLQRTRSEDDQSLLF